MLIDRQPLLFAMKVRPSTATASPSGSLTLKTVYSACLHERADLRDVSVPRGGEPEPRTSRPLPSRAGAGRRRGTLFRVPTGVGAGRSDVALFAIIVNTPSLTTSLRASASPLALPHHGRLVDEDRQAALIADVEIDLASRVEDGEKLARLQTAGRQRLTLYPYRGGDDDYCGSSVFRRLFICPTPPALRRIRSARK